MPKDSGFHSLKMPSMEKGAMPVDGIEKDRYPTLHIGVDDWPELGNMKLGATGKAEIEFKISKHGGLDILAIKGAEYGPDNSEKKNEI